MTNPNDDYSFNTDPNRYQEADEQQERENKAKNKNLGYTDSDRKTIEKYASKNPNTNNTGEYNDGGPESSKMENAMGQNATNDEIHYKAKLLKDAQDAGISKSDATKQIQQIDQETTKDQTNPQGLFQNRGQKYESADENHQGNAYDGENTNNSSLEKYRHDERMLYANEASNKEEFKNQRQADGNSTSKSALSSAYNRQDSKANETLGLNENPSKATQTSNEAKKESSSSSNSASSNASNGSTSSNISSNASNASNSSNTSSNASNASTSSNISSNASNASNSSNISSNASNANTFSNTSSNASNANTFSNTSSNASNASNSSNTSSNASNTNTSSNASNDTKNSKEPTSQEITNYQQQNGLSNNQVGNYIAQQHFAQQSNNAQNPLDSAMNQQSVVAQFNQYHAQDIQNGIATPKDNQIASLLNQPLNNQQNSQYNSNGQNTQSTLQKYQNDNQQIDQNQNQANKQQNITKQSQTQSNPEL